MHQKLKSTPSATGEENGNVVTVPSGSRSGSKSERGAVMRSVSTSSSSPKRSSFCPGAIKGPAILTGVGLCFALLGLVPFLITMVTKNKNSATLIGLGFMGFGALLLIPGLCWCIVVLAQRRIYRPWKSRFSRRRSHEEKTPALSSQHEDQIA